MAIVRKSLLGLVAACVVHGAAFAQDEQQLIKDAFHALMLKKPDEALAKLQAVIAKNPSNATAIDLYTRIDGEIWRELLMQKGEMGEIARHILSLAKAGKVELSRDAAAIEALVKTATSGASGDFGTRQKAVVELMNKHGEFAVPAMIKVLGNHDDEQGQTYAIIALRQIGRVATLPLIEATASSNPTLRRNIAAVFNLTRDHRAVPALTTLMKDGNEGVVEVASTALRTMGASASADPVSLYLQQGQDYMVGIGTSGMDISDVVWAFNDGKLTYQECVPAVYQFELAKQSAQKALVMDPGSAAAKTLVARSYLAQVAAIENGNIDGLEGVKSNLKMAAMAMGPEVIGSALEASMRDRQPMVAKAAIEALGATEDKDSLGSSPLLAALDSENKIVKYAAALALTRASRANNVPRGDKVVAVLAEAVAEQAQKRIVTVGLDSANSQQVAEATGPRWGGIRTASFKTVENTIDRIYTQSIGADVVVVNEILPNAIPEDLIGLLSKNDRTKDIKVIVVAKDIDKAQERFGDKVAAVIPAGFKAEELKTKVDEALADVKDEMKTRAAAVAVDASGALHTLASNRVDVAGALASLAEQIKRSGEVAINSAKALGEAGNSIDPLVGQILSGDAAKELKIACAQAAGKILGRGAALSDAQFASLKGVAADAGADAELRTAVAIALGKASLSPAQRLALAQALATQAVTGN